MKIVIIGQEEPVYFSPYLSGIIEAIPEKIALVALVGKRGAGSHPRTFFQKLKNLYLLFLLLEPKGFFRSLCKQILPFSKSIRQTASKHNIPVLNVKNVNGTDFLLELKKLSPDLIINQSECLLKEKLLSIPKIGVVNRHASLLPSYRGRVGSFWSHAAKSPEYGVTIHFVDKNIDSGPIILQKAYQIDPASSYSRVLDLLFKDAVSLTLQALKKLESQDFIPQENRIEGTKTYLFPTLEEVISYRRDLKQRRS